MYFDYICGNLISLKWRSVHACEQLVIQHDKTHTIDYLSHVLNVMENK